MPTCPPVLPALATLRDMPGGYDQREAETPVALTFGLYQGQKITVAAIDAYDRALNALLLPRLLARLEGQMQHASGQAGFPVRSAEGLPDPGPAGPARPPAR